MIEQALTLQQGMRAMSQAPEQPTGSLRGPSLEEVQQQQPPGFGGTPRVASFQDLSLRSASFDGSRGLPLHPGTRAAGSKPGSYDSDSAASRALPGTWLCVSDRVQGVHHSTLATAVQIVTMKRTNGFC